MTCEISIMNRQALALAADSATTVHEWIGGKQQSRYFKGANKIFQLSNGQPVGLMTYGSATLHEAPWELLVKEFRTHLGATSFDDLTGYATRLFDFIKGHPLFPSEYQNKISENEIAKAALIYLFMVSQNDGVKNAKTEADKETAYKNLLDSDFQRVSASPLPLEVTQSDIDGLIASCKQMAENRIQQDIAKRNLAPSNIDVGKLTNLAIQIISKEFKQYMAQTGIVIAGFGNRDYFPAYEEYTCYGLLFGRVLYEKVDSQRIDLQSPSFIKGFATTTMVNTFQSGCSPDVFAEVHNQFHGGLKALSDKIMQELKLTTIPNLDAHIDTVLQEHMDNWFGNALATHNWPLRRVIGSLPVDEMAELAETLIMLESLKEKVTQPTESVGGPIDVAVITKTDGFIWIKRKHYFNPDLNPRFFVRQRNTL